MSTTRLDADIDTFLEPLRDGSARTVAVMVSSVDGRATVRGRVGELTGEADQQVLLGARELAVALVVGGRTVRNEGYEQLLDEDAQHRRRERGLSPEPELAVFTHSSPAPAELLRQLRERHPEGLIVCEGGPTLLGMLVEDRLLDELVLGISPLIVGDDAQKRLLEHAGELNLAVDLLAMTAAGGFLFLRYGL